MQCQATWASYGTGSTVTGPAGPTGPVGGVKFRLHSSTICMKESTVALTKPLQAFLLLSASSLSSPCASSSTERVYKKIVSKAIYQMLS